MKRALRVVALIVCAWILAFWSLPLRAESPDLLAVGAQSVVVRGDTVAVAFAQPCGTDLMGWVIHHDAKERVLRVGALLRRGDSLCAGLPKRTIGVLRHLRAASYARVIPYAELGNNDDKLAIARLSELHARPAAQRSEAEGIVALHCGQVVGSVVVESDSETRLGVLETLPTARPDTPACAITERPVRFPFVALAQHRSIAPIASLSAADADIRDQFSLRVARTVNLRRGQGLTVNFIRRCNEAPVGVILGDKPAPGGTLDVGVLVARYPKLTCPKNRAEWIQHTWRANSLHLPKNIPLRVMSQTQPHTRLYLKTPVRYGLSGTESADARLTFKFLGGCQRPIGAVYTPDPTGALTVAVVERERATTCAAPVRELTMLQPTIFAGTAARDLFPMEVRGLGATL